MAEDGWQVYKRDSKKLTKDDGTEGALRTIGESLLCDCNAS
jgi:hypothetical protein